MLKVCCLFSSHSEHKCVVASLQFSDGYPSCPLLVQLKSKTFPDHLLRSMEALCEQHLQKHKGKQQVGMIPEFFTDLSHFFDHDCRFCCCCNSCLILSLETHFSSALMSSHTSKRSYAGEGIDV